ncbi:MULTISPECIES: Rossmann-fold NAD(P)-binding domain-containing protein [Nocardiopsidaceae]|uniref:NmrA family transcriptional regulator n=1 Tax=Streptomonospora nanhaiensis TaxID=1323731 RepID=A0ABY6YQZ5_9ACTN|nr:NmrA family transcriptional regulator [Streptomonospora nanhaiensis]WAE74709.1 NmrA family transcriptional regulator [Streptomonospora nanhaiensis]
MNTNDTVLVTGGTGMTGRRVTSLLRRLGAHVRVGSRAGAPAFDWHDAATWDAVLDDVTSVYLCFHPDLAFPGAERAVSAFAARAAERGARRMVLLSGRGEEGARAAEEAVRRVFPGLTVLRCSVFAQDFSESFLLGPVMDGTLALPVPDVPEPFVDLDDVAEVAVRALVSDGHAGVLYELTGPEAVTFTEAARIVGGASGRPVAYLEVTEEEFVAGAVGAGVPVEVARGLAALFGEILDGRNSSPADGVERALGRPATGFDAYARRAARAGAWSG